MVEQEIGMQREEEQVMRTNGYRRRPMAESSDGRFRGQGDPLVVSCLNLKEVFDPIIEAQDQWRRDFQSSNVDASGEGKRADPTGRERGERSSQAPLGGRANLAAQLEIDYRRVHKIVTCEQKWIGFGLVDIWLQKLGLTHLIDDGTIKAVPNPRWSRENWEAWSNRNGGCVLD